MAAGLPVIATDCPWGPGEIVRHGVDGWLVAPEDVDALAAGLDLLMGDPALRARLAAEARRSVQRFGRARVMALWDELVDDLRPDAARPAAQHAMISQPRPVAPGHGRAPARQGRAARRPAPEIATMPEAAAAPRDDGRS
jgi:hypothetical protein